MLYQFAESFQGFGGTMARGLSESFKLDEGFNRQGIHTELIFQGDEVIKNQTYDAQPFLEAARAERAATAGQRWGEMRKVGTIPPLVHAQALTIRDQKERSAYLLNWLKSNPLMVSFDKFLLK